MGMIKNKWQGPGRQWRDPEKIEIDAKELYKKCIKKDPDELDDYDHVVRHPEKDILDSEVKWALGSTAVNKS